MLVKEAPEISVPNDKYLFICMHSADYCILRIIFHWTDVIQNVWNIFVLWMWMWSFIYVKYFALACPWVHCKLQQILEDLNNDRERIKCKVLQRKYAGRSESIWLSSIYIIFWSNRVRIQAQSSFPSLDFLLTDPWCLWLNNAFVFFV